MQVGPFLLLAARSLLLRAIASLTPFLFFFDQILLLLRLLLLRLSLLLFLSVRGVGTWVLVSVILAGRFTSTVNHWSSIVLLELSSPGRLTPDT